MSSKLKCNKKNKKIIEKKKAKHILTLGAGGGRATPAWLTSPLLAALCTCGPGAAQSLSWIRTLKEPHVYTVKFTSEINQ